MNIDKEKLIKRIEKLTVESTRLQNILSSTAKDKDEVDTTVILLNRTLKALDDYDVLVE